MGEGDGGKKRDRARSTPFSTFDIDPWWLGLARMVARKEVSHKEDRNSVT